VIWAQKGSPDPAWWAKYQYLSQHAADAPAGKTTSLAVGTNVNVSQECGPQSETFIALNPGGPSILAAGSNEIFRDPMRGYYSSDGGSMWGGVDLPLPPPQGANGVRFGSDPSLAFDSHGNVFYSYIVVFFGNGNGVNGTEMAVARSGDGGKTYPWVTYFAAAGGSDHFNDKPMIAADANPGSPYRDNVYVAWDAAAGGSCIVVRFLFKHRRIDQVLEGSPTTLISGGKIVKEGLSKELLTESELAAVAHKQGFESIAEIDSCVLEPGGNFYIKSKTPPTYQRQHGELLELLKDVRERVVKLEKRL
jgi:hypothetical protein